METAQYEPPQGWVCTDPDTYQYRKQLSETEFLFRQYNELKMGEFPSEMTDDIWYNTLVWVEDTIDVFDYLPSDRIYYMSSFYSKEQIAEIILNKDYEIMAECIFENDCLNP